MGLVFPASKARHVKPWHAAEPPEGWEEHMFSYRDRRRLLMPHTPLTSTPFPLPQKENHILEEDAEMSALEKSSYRDEGGGDGDEVHAGDVRSDGQADMIPVILRTSSKHKGRAIDVTDDDVAGINCEAPPPKAKKPGVMSQVALDDIHEFASKVKKEAEELGQCHGRSTHDILVTARFGVKPSHMKLNEANLFCSWYWAMQPKPDGAKRDTINDIITKEYKSLIQDIPMDDTAARREKLKHVYKWSKNSSAVPTSKSVKSIAARVQNAKTQFSGLVHGSKALESSLTVQQAEAWSNLKETEIAGVVMYVGQDPAGHQTSSIFGGSDMVRSFINQCAVNVCTLMDKYTSIFKCLRDGSGPEAGLPSMSSARESDSSWELCCCIQEILRDQNHRLSKIYVVGITVIGEVFILIISPQVTHGIEVGDPQKIIWQCLLEFMMKNYLIILNWPHGVSPPGPGFKYKKLKGNPLRKLMVPYFHQKFGTMYDGQSDDDKEDSLDDVTNMLDSSHLKGEIPLVKAADGMVLCKVSDDPSWQKKACEGEESRQEDQMDPPQQCQLPFPSCKQAHLEVLNDSTMVHMLCTLRIKECLIATAGILALFKGATDLGQKPPMRGELKTPGRGLCSSDPSPSSMVWCKVYLLYGWYYG
ncbi:hypothetical protein EDD17DRAFT_1502910 [Pisolithus thermaeus]|nr:hypothetical protein EDD17DRAFT_1502910 [Pisolithus thermaeus]